MQSVWQSGFAKCIDEDAEILRALERKPLVEVGDARRLLELIESLHQYPGLVLAASMSVNRGENGDGQYPIWQMLRCLIRP